MLSNPSSYILYDLLCEIAYMYVKLTIYMTKSKFLLLLVLSLLIPVVLIRLIVGF